MELWMQVIFAILICLLVVMLMDKAYTLGYNSALKKVIDLMNEFVKNQTGKNIDYKDDNTGWTP